MKILQTNFHQNWGGQATHVFLLSKGLPRRGHQVTVGAPEGSVLYERARQAGLEVLPGLWFARGCSPFSRARDAWTLREALRKEHFDFIHTHGSQDTWSGALAAKKTGLNIPVVFTRHNTFPIRAHAINRWLYRALIDRVIIVSESVAEQYRPLIQKGVVKREELVTIPTPLQRDRFHAGVSGERVRRELGIAEETPVIGLAARLAPEKGHHLLLDAAARLKENHPQVKILFAGRGREEANLRAQSRRLGLEKSVFFLGFREDAPEVAAAFDIAVLPAIGCDASSNVVKEAMALGKPVVATEVGGIREMVIPESTGLLVPPGDVSALDGALGRLLADRAWARRLGQAGQKRIAALFTEEVFIDRHEKLFGEVLSARPQARSF